MKVSFQKRKCAQYGKYTLKSNVLIMHRNALYAGMYGMFFLKLDCKKNSLVAKFICILDRLILINVYF